MKLCASVRSPTVFFTIFCISNCLLFELSFCIVIHPEKSFKIESCPRGGPTTVHMRLFTSDEFVTNAYNSIIHDNMNLCWTLWSHSPAFQSSLLTVKGSQNEYFVPFVYNFTYVPTPTINFY